MSSHNIVVKYCSSCNEKISLSDGGVSFGKNGINHINCLEIKLRGENYLKKKRNYRV